MAQNVAIDGNTYSGVSVLQAPLAEDTKQMVRFVEEDEVLSVVILTESEYYALLDAGELDEGTLYFVTEDVGA